LLQPASHFLMRKKQKLEHQLNHVSK
jgi:hypothetical protein